MPNVVRFALCVNGAVIVTAWHGGACVYCDTFETWRDVLQSSPIMESGWIMRAGWRVCGEDVC